MPEALEDRRYDLCKGIPTFHQMPKCRVIRIEPFAGTLQVEERLCTVVPLAGTAVEAPGTQIKHGHSEGPE